MSPAQPTLYPLALVRFQQQPPRAVLMHLDGVLPQVPTSPSASLPWWTTMPPGMVSTNEPVKAVDKCPRLLSFRGTVQSVHSGTES